MKRSDQSASGTSFYNSVFRASKSHLVEAIGEPDWTCNDIEDKSQNDWTCETENGDVFTIYDWKEYRFYDNDEIIEWHIGGHSGSVTEQAKQEIEVLLNQVTL
jgi:hypothetical protein